MSSSRLVHAAAVPANECLDPNEIAIAQASRLAQLVGAIDGRNQFFTRKLASAGVSARDVRDLSILAALPLTTKAELVADQESHGPWCAEFGNFGHFERTIRASLVLSRPLRLAARAQGRDHHCLQNSSAHPISPDGRGDTKGSHGQGRYTFLSHGRAAVHR